MGVFSFGRKTSMPRGRHASNAHTALRSKSVDESKMRVDPLLPEKQRARYRLVGAILLVLVAIAVLPRLLNPPAQPGTGDIEVWVAAQTAIPSHMPSNPSVAPRTQSVPSTAVTAVQVDTLAQPSSAPASLESPVNGQKPSQSSTPSVLAQPTPGPSGHSKDAISQSHFVVQAGIFAREQEARAYWTRLKKAKLPAYLERKKQARRVWFLVQIGPFDDRKQAEKALKKLSAAGLSTGQMEQSKNIQRGQR